MSDGTAVELDIDTVNELLPERPDAAAGLLIEAARKGRADAQAWLGQLYLDGRGVLRDDAEALYWFQRSAHAGVPMAMNMLGRCYENAWGTSADYALATVWYQRAAAHDLDWAIYNMAQMYANGRGVVKDRTQAFRWFTRAATLGHARSMHFLGQFYEYGWEVNLDQAHAFELYRRSAEGGDYRGMCSWASVLTEAGHLNEALSWIERAAPLAPDHYVAPLIDKLSTSSYPDLHALAQWLARVANR